MPKPASKSDILEAILDKVFPYSPLRLRELARGSVFSISEVEPFIDHLGTLLKSLRKHDQGKTVNNILRSIKLTYPEANSFHIINRIIAQTTGQNIAEAQLELLQHLIAFCLTELKLKPLDLLILADLTASYFPLTKDLSINVWPALGIHVDAESSSHTLYHLIATNESLDFTTLDYIMRNVEDLYVAQNLIDLASANPALLIDYFVTRQKDILAPFRFSISARLNSNLIGCAFFSFLSVSGIPLGLKQQACSSVLVPLEFWLDMGAYLNEIPQELLLLVSNYYESSELMRDILHHVDSCPPYIACLLAVHPDKGLADSARYYLDDLE